METIYRILLNKKRDMELALNGEIQHDTPLHSGIMTIKAIMHDMEFNREEIISEILKEQEHEFN